MISLLRRYLDFLTPSLGLRSLGRWVVYGVVAGLFSGLGAAAFYFLLDLVGYGVFDCLAGTPRVHPAGEGLFEGVATGLPRLWIFFLLPAVGGLFSGIVVQRFAPEAAGVGTEALIEAFHRHRGQIRTRVPFVKAVGTLFTLGFGGASGREGPIAQIGGGMGSYMARVLGLGSRERRILLLAGAAGGFGAIFRAPLGGAITAVEVLYREDLETDALVPCVISSVTAYAFFSVLFGFRSIFALPHDLEFSHPAELPFYLALGLFCVPFGALTVRVFWGVTRCFRRLKSLPAWLLPAMGGVLVGVLGIVSPGVYGSGWGVVQQALRGEILIGAMLLLAVGKILAMGLTLGSGGSGGVFGPTLFIGAMLGGVFGVTAKHLFPGIAPDPAAVIVVGMCAFFAGVANAPLGALLMTIEISRSYGLVAPLMLVSVIAVLFTSRWSIFQSQVKNKFHSPAHHGEMNGSVLEGLTVAEVMRPAEEIDKLMADEPFSKVRERVATSDEIWFPVVDHGSGRLVGVFSLQEVRAHIFDRDLDPLLVAADVMGPAATVPAHADLFTGLRRILDSGYGEIPVVDEESGRLVGLLRHADVLRAYHREVAARPEEEEEERQEDAET